jgi:hypothetical protein
MYKVVQLVRLYMLTRVFEDRDDVMDLRIRQLSQIWNLVSCCSNRGMVTDGVAAPITFVTPE